jgi:chromosome segregation ATPase
VQTGRVKDLIQHSVTNAQNALDEIRSSVAGTQKALAARQTEQAAALVQVQEAKKAYAAGTKKIGQLDAEIAELQERYTQALPSATGKPLK